MLKPDRFFNRADSEVSYYMGEVAEQGIVVCYRTGAALPPVLDTSEGYAIVPTATTDKAIGVLMDNVVDKDLTECELNCNKREVQIDGKVEIVRQGWVVTNMIDTGVAPSPGDDAHFVAGGLFTDVAGSQKVGVFESAVSPEGYARIRLLIS